MFLKLLYLCLALSGLGSVDGMRVLVAFPMMSKSHSILGHTLVDHLLNAGHEVVHLTAFPREKKVPNYKEINVEDLTKRLRAGIGSEEAFKLKNLIGQGNFGDSSIFHFFVYNFHKGLLEEQNIVDFLTDPKEKFDAVVIEWFFSDLLAGLAPLFKCPLIWAVSTEAHWQALRLIDELPNPAFNVDLFSQSRPPLTFTERITELWITIKKSFFKAIAVQFEKRVYYSLYPDLAEKRGVILPSYEEAVFNGSLMLLNSHPSIGTPFRLPQSAKYIGGYHVNQKVPSLPKNLQTIMDNAKHGVIYFSMGSNLKSEDMSEIMKESLLQMFGKLKQTVIWKFEGNLENVPANVLLVKWAPQQSILAHDNLKLFITHGGQLSTIESIHHGVPVLGIPVYGDQHINMVSVKNKGFGLFVDIGDDMAGKLSGTIHEMLSNPTYMSKAKDLSLVYHDRLKTPGDELVFWVEHVVRTRGAPHLRSPALDVPAYQKLYLDLIALIAIPIGSILYIWKKFKRISKGKGKKQKKH